MSKYKMDDGKIVDTTKALYRWEEETFFDGRNRISNATGSQWEHQRLYRSAKGRYYLECSSQWQGTHPYARWVSREEAATWLIANGHGLPPELEEFENDLVE
jgi:hypothetical protein